MISHLQNTRSEKRARFQTTIGIRGALLFPLLGYTIASAQVPVTSVPAFEVASVKRNLSGRTGGSIRVPPAGAVSFTNMPLRVLIRDAYQVDPFTEQFRLISGGLSA